MKAVSERPSRACWKSAKVVTLVKKSPWPRSPSSGARFTRQKPGPPRFDWGKPSQRYIRARYYDCRVGIFIQRDPLEYVDGMSLYRGYFVPAGVDPKGEAEITEYRPQKDIVGFPWQKDDSLRFPTLGTTSAELFVDCWCKKVGPGIGLRLLTTCLNTISIIVIGGSGTGSGSLLPDSYKLIHHKIRFTAKIKLSPRNILRTNNRHTLQSVYSHEQRHLKSLRTKAEEIAGKLSSRSFPTKDKCLAACADDYKASKDEFKKYVDNEIDHQNPLSPSDKPESARDYDPYAGEFPANPKDY